MISAEDKDIIYNFTQMVDVNVDDIKNVDDLTSLMEDFEHNFDNYTNEVDDLRLQFKKQEQKIKNIEKQNIKKQDTIAEQRKEISSLKKEVLRLEQIISVWQEFWKKILEFFQDKFFSSKDEIYEQVINDMVEENILNNEDIDYIQNDYYLKKEEELEK